MLFSFCNLLLGQISYEVAFPELSFNLPVEIINANDGTNRMFIVEQGGLIKVFPNSQTTSNSALNTFLDVRSKVNLGVGQEVGLLGMAFHPNYENNGYIYIYYTDYPNNIVNMNLSRFTVSSSNQNVIDPNSEIPIFKFAKNQPEGNHNGGKIAFGPDGYLYISIGDGGGGGDPKGNAQNLNNVFGSILRIDVDLDGNNPIESNPDAPNGNYEIPSDNPRVGLSGLDELYVWGIRNTWKFSFDNTTGNLWGADVGQGRRCEINIITKGQNYGWGKFEGLTTYNSSLNLVTTPDTKPIFEYNYTNGDRSITGGYVYRGPLNNDALTGKYIYGDYVSGRVWALDYNTSTGETTSEMLFRTNGQFISSFGLDESGQLYFSDYGNSVKLYKISGESSGPTSNAVTGVGDWNKAGFEGVNGTVEAIQKVNETYYVGGNFTNASGISAQNIAKYDKVNGWGNFGSGVNGTVYSIAADSNGLVYIGGEFTSVSGVSASNVAFWDGTNWNPLGSGTNGPVAKINIDTNDKAYIGGTFDIAGSIVVNNIALWENSTWKGLTDSNTQVTGTNNEIRAISFDENDNLYVGGNFDSAGGISTPRMAVWDGTNWNSLGQGTSGFVQAISVTNDYVYVGGNFAIAGNQTVNRIARWNRNTLTWSSLNNGLSGNVNTLEHDGTFLYAGGSFETASTNTEVNEIMNGVARWSENDGWQALGPNTQVGVSNVVNHLEFSSNLTELICGGNFSTAGGQSLTNIAVWGLDIKCDSNEITIRYTVDGIEIASENSININEGSSLTFGIEEAIYYKTIFPDNSTKFGPATINNITTDQSGDYVLTTFEGCSKTVTVNVNGTAICNKFSITPEYQVNGINSSGQNELTVLEGTSFVLGVLQNEGFNIISPNNSEIVGELDFGALSIEDSGTYIIRTTDGCTENFVLNVTENNSCNSSSITPSYIINGIESNGLNEITLSEGNTLVLGIIQQTGYTITFPDRTIVEGEYDFGPISLSQSGTYTFRTVNGCLEDFILNVTNSNSCTSFSITPEYTINGDTSSGLNRIDINEGVQFKLGILQGDPFTVTLPDNSVIQGELDFGDVALNESGTYILKTAQGCVEDFILNVLPAESNCNSLSITPEYVINGNIANANNEITITEGSTLTLRITQNINYDITSPDGSNSNGELNFGIVEITQSGIYLITTNAGCSEEFIVNIIEDTECTRFSITPKYSINGVNSIGLNKITLIEGETLILGIMQSTPFTITFPNNSVLNGRQNLGTLDTSQSGTYTIESIDGCTEDFILQVVIDESLLDNDSDGVVNNIDICPNTAANVSVDENGCALFSLPTSNFTISTTGTTCSPETDGQLSITTELELNYSAVITSDSYNEIRTFTTELNSNELPAGEYEICITLENITSYILCSTFVIGTPEPLTVLSSIDQLNQFVTLKMSGGNEYFVTLNEVRLKTSSNEITLKLSEEQNIIKVSTEKVCQGIFEENILISIPTQVYPNPFINSIIINTQNFENTSIDCNLYDLSGKNMMSQSLQVDNRLEIEIKTFGLIPGVYILELSQDASKEIFKLVKR
jgi:hypothetical protein